MTKKTVPPTPAPVQPPSFHEKVNADYYRTTLPYGEKGSVDRIAYNLKERENYDEFTRDIEEEYGTAQYPKVVRDALFPKA